MKIRDLEKYVEFISGDPNWRGKIGKEGDPFYSKLFGEDFNLEYYVGHISDFAENSNEQIFYELIQNASDAGASSFFVGFDEGNFVVLNNGEPFISDGKKAKNSKSRLRSFLTKNKGPKAGESESIGKHGQGSKLLYDLIIPTASSVIEGSTNKEDLLEKAIIKEKKGPILYSWENISLRRFLYWDYEVFESGDHNDTSIPLLTKLIFSYFPAYPESDPDSWFSYEELENCTAFLKKISEQINVDDFFSGTLLYLPLGEGRFEELKEILGGNLISGIRTSLALLPNIDRVKINEEIILKPQDFKNILIREVENEKSETLRTRLFLPEIPKELDDNLSNFFQYFPISSEIYGLKFIIDSQEYAIKGSRQSIDLSDGHNKKTLIEISASIINYYSDLVGKGNVEEAIHFIKCVLGSGGDISNNPKEKAMHIKKYFYDDIIDIIKSSIPTHDGQFLPVNSVRVKKSTIPVDLKQIGQNQIHWVNDDLKEYSEEVVDQLKVGKWTIKDVIDNCPNDEIRKDFVYGLTDDEYRKLLLELIIFLKNVNKKYLKFIKSTSGNLYSINDILNGDDIILAESRTSPLIDIFKGHKVDFAGEQLLKYSAILSKVEQEYNLKDKDLIDRIQNLLENKNLVRDEKWKLFKTYESFSGINRDFLRKGIRLFSNKRNERVSFNKLLSDTSHYAKSSLLNLYQIYPVENYFNDFEEYYMKEVEIWENVYGDWGQILDTLADSNYQIVLQDLQHIFDLADNPSRFEDDVDWILTDEEEWITSDDLFYNPKLNALNKEDYDELKSLVKSISTFKMVDFQYLRTLSEGNFFYLSSKSLGDLSERLNEDSYQLIKRQIQLLSNIRINNEDFFTSFFITKGSDFLYLNKNDKPKKKQFYSKDLVLNDFLGTTDTYKLLPSELTDFFENDNSLRIENEEFINSLIAEFGAEKALVYAVKRQGQNVKENYLNRFQRIDLFSSSERQRYSGEFEGEIIQLIVQLKKEGEFREKIFIDGIALNEITHEDQVRINYRGESIIVFRLSDLRNESEGDGLAIVKSKLQGVNYGSLFTLEEYSQDDLYDELLEEDGPLTEEQIAFLIAFDQAERNEFNTDHQYIFNDVEDIPLLDKFLEKGIDKFEKYLPDHFFHPSRHIYSTDTSLVLENERVPNNVLNWISSGEKVDKINFLETNGLIIDSYQILKARSSIQENKRLTRTMIKSVSKDPYFANNNFEWISENFEQELANRKALYWNCHELILEYFKVYGCPPEKLIQISQSSYKEELFVKIAEWKGKLNRFYLKHLDSDDFPRLLEAKLKLNLSLIDVSYPSYGKMIEFFEGNEIYEAELKSEIVREEFEEPAEWNISFYEEWLERIGNATRIFLSEQEVPFKYRLKYGDRNYDYEHQFYNKVAFVPYSTEKQYDSIYVNEKDTSAILDLLVEKKEELFKGRKINDLTELLALAQPTSEDRDLVETLRENMIKTEYLNVLGNALGKEEFSSEQLKNWLTQRGKNEGQGGVDLGKELTESELSKLKTSIDDVNSLLSKIDPEKLKLLLEHIDSIEQLLETEDDKSTPNQIIGHIGEVLMVEWLKLKHNDDPEATIKHVSVIRDLRSGVKATYKPFDIEMEYLKKPYYLDVKTTIKSLNDLSKSFAFFISRKEYDHIKRKKLRNYFISRISLQDLGLKFIYDKIKREYTGLSLEEIPKEVDDYIIEECNNFLISKEGIRKIEEHRFIFEVSIPKGMKDSPF